ncbi:galactose-binding domain-like protein [Pyronema domesticum]|uniref:allantoicase n=1 Tax=Pyronema omphalodes (strain CBS 100304) TaxID=1076935 RepID=U4L7I3_PYROM|nr:galactose-binding domain-like protein [Pyronema domesticum]CCX13605.1 Similar to Probable allantoicase; acc. no. Q09913 [Pyronema omphalodes CBS 100304]
MSVEKIEESRVQEVFGASCIDLISSALGGEVLSFSDEFFAEASNLINPAAPIRRPGYFVETGAWYDGWETRRHNSEEADWVIVKLGVPSGIVHGIEIDTAFFSGNHAPLISVEGIFLDGSHPTSSSPWTPILPPQPCGPTQRHIWLLPSPTTSAFSHVRLRMYPDGGIARFRLYGVAVPVFPSDLNSIIDLAHVGNGGLAVACSDQHFGTKDNLLLPGRGKDMGDGWETARSRVPGHKDWVIVKLGARGCVEEVVVDTMHFRGNFPKGVEIWGIDRDSHLVDAEDQGWELIVGEAACSKDMQHAFTVENGLLKGQKVVSHVKMVIIPDGGVKRLRVFGRRVEA